MMVDIFDTTLDILVIKQVCSPCPECSNIVKRQRDCVIKPPVFVLKTGGFGPSGETRSRGILVPNQAPYQLGHTRI